MTNELFEEVFGEITSSDYLLIFPTAKSMCGLRYVSRLVDVIDRFGEQHAKSITDEFRKFFHQFLLTL